MAILIAVALFCVASVAALDDFYAQWHTLEQVEERLHYLAETYSNRTQLRQIGTSHEGRPIWVLSVGADLHSRSVSRRREVWLDGGMHAREWSSVHVVLYLAEILANGTMFDGDRTGADRHWRWHVAPVVNPDGYAYTWSGTAHSVRFWRKNRAPEHCVVNFGEHICCQGVDLNRNFDVMWHNNRLHTTGNPCLSYFRGTGPFSEPEALAVRDFILPRRKTTMAFVTIHAYGQFWLLPYSYTADKRPGNHKQLKAVAQQSVRALRSVRGTTFRIGSSAEFRTPAPGTSADWAFAQGIPYSYGVELPPKDRDRLGTAGFVPKVHTMLNIREEMKRALVAMVAAIRSPLGK